MEQSETERYDPEAVEAKWQALWAAEDAFTVPNPDLSAADGDRSTYVLEMLPYPSGELHMGHVFNYTLGDVFTHVRRRQGYTVLRPMGYDAFGLNAENAAIREGGHPREITNRNIEAIRRQMRRMGWAIDWSREVSTAEPEYYRWTQWLFLRFFERGLAYRREAPVKWCPKDQTVLANEQVIDGRCERCGTEVEARNLTQWFFKITDYADQLLDEMALLESWPERVLTMQRNWIGRSEGARVTFTVAGSGEELPVFTTRPDTLFGATFFVLAPEHPMIPQLTAGSEHEQAVAAYVRHTAARSAVERETKEKDGVFTGRFAVNPVNGESIPIWVADYVLMEYGTGAIMAVPAHDERDHAFAEKYGIEIRQVVAPAGGSASAEPAGSLSDDEGAYVAHTDDEVLVNSGEFTGRTAPEGKRAITAWLAGARPRRGDDRLPAARLAALPAALLGLPDPGRPLRRVRDRARARRRAPGAPPRDRRLPAEGEVAARGGRGLGHDDVPELLRPRAPRDGHDGHLRRLVLVLPPLRGRTERRGGVGPADRRLLAARQAVHRRCRARRAAPALRAVLHEGAQRHGAARLPRAVLAPLHPGDDLPARREDVEDEGERRLPRRGGRAVRRRRAEALHPLHGAGRARQGVERRRHRGDGPAARPDLAPHARGRGAWARRGSTPTASSCVRPTGRSTASRTTSCAASSSTRRSRRCSSSSTRSTASRTIPRAQARCGSRPRPSCR